MRISNESTSTQGFTGARRPLDQSKSSSRMRHRSIWNSSSPVQLNANTKREPKHGRKKKHCHTEVSTEENRSACAFSGKYLSEWFVSRSECGGRCLQLLQLPAHVCRSHLFTDNLSLLLSLYDILFVCFYVLFIFFV